MAGLTILAPPSAWPITTDEAKLHCRVTHTSEDDYIDGLVRSATAYVEKNIGRSIASQQWRLSLDGFHTPIDLPNGPVATVDAFKYLDENGDEQTLDAAVYIVDLVSYPAQVRLAPDQSWPTTLSGVNTVWIDYTAGSATVSDDLKQALYLLVGHWYANRETVVVGTISQDLQYAVSDLLSNYRWIIA